MPVKMNGDASVFSYIYTNEGKPFLRLLLYLPPGGGGGLLLSDERISSHGTNSSSSRQTWLTENQNFRGWIKYLIFFMNAIFGDQGPVVQTNDVVC